jgi:hypothetical protein
MYEYCLGIRPDISKPGVQKVKFAPCFDRTGKITSAEGYYDSDFGRIQARWEQNADTFTYVATVPQEIETEFDFGAMKILSQTARNNEYNFILQF